jgi:GR25 family glycosyltransferase involved in LPS biosynthesis
LILEDDADWDVGIKSQIREFARGLHALKGNNKIIKQAPYGTDWDLLWIGGCATGPDANQTQFYAIPDNPTVPSTQHRATWAGPLETWKAKFPEDSTRFIYRAEAGCCTYGYAVTSKGAKKILAALAIDHIEAAVDNAMSHLCGGLGGRRRVECFAPFPNIIGTYRPAGPAFRDSDIATNSDERVHEEQAFNLVYSTRRNIHRLVAGEETVLSQWGGESPWSPREVNTNNFVYPRGYLIN